MPVLRRTTLTTAAVALAVGAALFPLDPVAAPGGADAVQVDPTVGLAAERLPLAGRVVVVDPGHQLGNRSHRAEVDALVGAGGFRKACNTAGTSTDGGYPEATFAHELGGVLARRLEALGARVVLTRSRNAEELWGPCVDQRGRAGNGIEADLKLSLHADGRYGGGPGFHVIAPVPLAGLTDDIVVPSLRLARDIRSALVEAGFPVAGYVAGGDGLDERADLATLNLSDVPVVMAELGNMRDAGDAAWMESRAGRERCAEALAAAVVTWLGRSGQGR